MPILRFVSVGLLCLAAGACASPGDASKLAGAGADYGGSMVALLGITKSYAIRASSERMIDDGNRQGITKLQAFQTHEKVDTVLVQIDRLQRVAALMQRYFLKLQELATTDEVEQARVELEGAAKALISAANTLGGTPINLAIGPVSQDAILRGVTTIIVGTAQRIAIDRELDQRGVAIGFAIERFRAVTADVKEKLEDDAMTIARFSYRREVREPFVTGALQPKDYTSWMTLRAKHKLEPFGVPGELAKAEAAAAKLGSEWDRVRKKREVGPTSIQEIVEAASDLKAFVSAFKGGN